MNDFALRMIDDMGVSVADANLQHLFTWYAKADLRVNAGITSRVCEVWRERIASGDTADCLTICRELEAELREMQAAKAEELGLTTDPV